MSHLGLFGPREVSHDIFVRWLPEESARGRPPGYCVSLSQQASRTNSVDRLHGNCGIVRSDVGGMRQTTQHEE